MTRIGLLIGTLLLAGVIAAGCGNSATSAGNSSAPATMTGGPASSSESAAGPTITISGMAFGDPITVPSGATIAIVNEDGVEHSVTSDKGAFDTDVDGGERKTFTAPTQPGKYPFICVYHTQMKGSLIVE